MPLHQLEGSGARDRWADTLTPSQVREPSMHSFGVVMIIGFGVLGGLLLWLWTVHGGQWRLALSVLLLSAGIIVFGWSIVSPKSLPPVYRAWMTFGQVIGTVVSSILLTLMYFLVLTPVGLLMRLMGNDPINRQVRRAEESYWVNHQQLDTDEGYTHMS